MRAASLSLGLGLCLLALGCAGGKAAVIGASSNDATSAPVSDAAPPSPAALDAGSDAQADQADQGEPTDTLPPVIDPAVSHALLAKTGEASGPAPLGLRFEIVELGSELPWAFAIVNRGTEAAVVDFDARLLSLQIMPPPDEPDELSGTTKAKPKIKRPPKPVTCRLPGDVAPSTVDPALELALEPGEGLVQNFDPRLYCVGKAPWPLVEGAVVSPRFGWPVAVKVSWHAGKRAELPAVQHEPFVAEPSAAQGSLPGSPSAEAGERRVKELTGTPLTLGSDFANARELPKGVDQPAGLVLSIGGGDASNEGAAVATATISNRGPKRQDIYFRRELISYEVSGPDGSFECDPEPDQRAPVDRSAIQTLPPGAKFSAVSRLIEMCPAHAFARPGLYLVHARFDSADSGEALGVHGFMGRLVSAKPALVRIRQGELPFTPLSNAIRVHVGE